MPTIAELIRALPGEQDEATAFEGRVKPLMETSTRPVPVGRVRRMGILGTLQAKIAAAYLFYWIRGWFSTADARERMRAETHWRTALRLLDSMGYLRGAVMKVGQTLASFPDIVPHEFVETLDQLYYAAPPMHWSLLREAVHNELGEDAEHLFGSFEKTAFAAASLGQVHRAQLRSGEPLAVKIQYPGIARAIAEDFQNFHLFLLTGRLHKEWDYIKSQMEDLRRRLEAETDYQQEAAMLAKAHALFRPEDGVVVPRVYPQLSTSRVLTMDRVEGVHLDDFLKSNPSQEQRNEAARKILRAYFRLLAAGRVVYADFHPGNFLFLKDGRVGIIDFGFMIPFDDELWALSRRMERALSSGRPEELAAGVKEWSWITDDPSDAERLQLSLEFVDWAWGCRYCGGEFDFGNEADFRRGLDLWMELVRKRYCRGRSPSPALARQQLGYRSLFYRLKAKIDVRPIAQEELLL